MVNLINRIFVIIILFVVINGSISLVLPGNGKQGDICQFPDDVKGTCEDVNECIKNNGNVRRNGTIQLCKLSGRSIITCCHKPFEVAKELCKAWSSYWRDNGGQCVYKEPLIIGGNKAGVGEFPHIALLGYENTRRKNTITWQCGGILISPHYAVTAAHCVLITRKYVLKFGEQSIFTGNKNNISRVFGTIPNGLYKEQDIRFERRNFAPIEQTIRVQKVILHPEYDLRYNDIALVLLEKPVVLTKRVMPACLPINKDDFSKSNVTVAGWGTVNPGQFILSDELLKVEVPVLDLLYCWESLQKTNTTLIPKGLTSEQLCAGEKGKDSCYGDSGGPLIARLNGACEHTLAGIVSFGYGCGTFGIYTRVSSYMDWIISHIAPSLIPGAKF